MRSRTALILALLPISAFAEVMDKEPTIEQVWLRAAWFALIGFVACRFRWWLLPIAFLYTSMLIGEVTDPSVGPAIREEAGLSYVSQVWASFLMTMLAQVAGAILHIRSRRRAAQAAIHPPVHQVDG